MRRFFRWILTLGVLAGIAVAVGYPVVQWWRKRSQVNFTTAPVSRGKVEIVVNSTGTIQPVRTVTVGAFVSGPIQEVLVDFNSQVKKDQVLARIDPRLFQAAVDRDQATLSVQKAELARIRALLQQAKNDEKRALKLREVNSRYISDTEMDQFRFARQSQEASEQLALANIAQAQANLKNSQANLNYAKIVAPEAGIVIDRKVNSGQTVAASFQTPELFTIAPDMDKEMHVFASVDEADIGQIRKAKEAGRVVQFGVDAYPDDLFEGEIYQIRKSATTEQNVVTYPVVIKAPNPDLKLLPGMTANISFSIEVKKDVLRVPGAALRFVPEKQRVHPDDRHHLNPLQRSDNELEITKSASEKAELHRKRRKRLVWVQEDKFLRAIPLTLGLIENRHAEVLAGNLKEGQAVVTGIAASRGAR